MLTKKHHQASLLAALEESLTQHEANTYLQPFFIKTRPNPSRLSSRTTADLHQPPIRAAGTVLPSPKWSPDGFQMAEN